MKNNSVPQAEQKRVACVKTCLNCRLIADATDAASCKICGIRLLELKSTAAALTDHRTLIAGYRRETDSLTKKQDAANAFLEQQGLFGEYQVKACVPDEFGLYGEKKTLVIFRHGTALSSIEHRGRQAILESILNFTRRAAAAAARAELGD